ncbi:hypothetical protein JCM21900_001481 [Sporobolomyces salmonicolor]
MFAPRAASSLIQTATRRPLRRPAIACCSCSLLVSSRPFSSRPPLSKAPAASPSRSASKILKDEDIPHRTIVLVDPTTKALLPPSTLSSLLAALDRTRYAIQLVDPAHDPPICRILDKKEVYQKAKDKKAKDAERAANTAIASGGETKEVHLTWGVTPHDLNHKLKKGRELLTKGHRLLIGLADKKRTAKVSPEIRDQLIKQVEQALEGHGTLKGRPSTRDGTVWLEFNKVAGK